MTFRPSVFTICDRKRLASVRAGISNPSAGGIKTALLVSYLFLTLGNAWPQPNADTKEDAFEPNQEFGEAAALPLGDPFAILLPPGDSDWFRMNATDSGLLMLHVLSPENGNWPRVELYMHQGETVEQRSFTARDAGAYAAHLEPGVYAFRFESGGSPDPHANLLARFIPNRAASNATDSGSLFLLGMEIAGGQAESLARIAAIGHGKSIAVSSQTANLTITLASVAKESRGEAFDIADFMEVMLEQVRTRLLEPPQDPFETTWMQQQAQQVTAALQDTDAPRKAEFERRALAGLLTSLRSDATFNSGNLAFDRSRVARRMHEAMFASISSTE